MSRAGYGDYDGDEHANLYYKNWRGVVASAIRGRRGQAFLRELRTALDEMPEKKLIDGLIDGEGNVCAIGALGVKRGIDLAKFDVEDDDHNEELSGIFNVATPLLREIECLNDEYHYTSPEDRFKQMYKYIDRWIVPTPETMKHVGWSWG